MGNNAHNNSYTGICIDTSNNNKVSENIITNNSITGLKIPNGSNNNSIYNNVFIKNTLHAEDYGSDNHWNSTMLGNYWDNYTDTDLDFDGIGDSPYNISHSPLIQDHLPIFQNPIHPGSKIHIDENGINAINWYKTALLNWWCTGSGTYSDPYVIKNLLSEEQLKKYISVPASKPIVSFPVTYFAFFTSSESISVAFGNSLLLSIDIFDFKNTEDFDD